MGEREGATDGSGRLAGRVALVTGAARGQGRSHCRRLAEEGADVIAVDLCADVEGMARFYRGPGPDDLRQTVDEVESLGRRAESAVLDVRDGEGLRAFVDQSVASLGRLDVVAANAGVFMFGEQAHEVGDADWHTVMDVNVTGVWQTVKAAVPHLIRCGRGGSVVITSSTAGIKGTPNVAAYTASKHAVVGLMKTLALELGPHSIRVNTVHPTSVDNEMIHNDALYRLFRPDLDEPRREDIEAAFTQMHVLPVPWVEDVDVSSALLFLVSDEARFVTGTQLLVDAGFSLR